MANSNKAEIGNVKAEFKAAPTETGFKRQAININDPNNQKNLVDLQWYLGIANPVYVKAKVKINKLQNGKAVETSVEKSVFDHFEFPNVAGKKFNEWLADKFGPDTKVDNKTKEVYTLVSDKDAPAPEPQSNDSGENQPDTLPEGQQPQ